MLTTQPVGNTYTELQLKSILIEHFSFSLSLSENKNKIVNNNLKTTFKG